MLAREVNLKVDDSFFTAIRRVTDTFMSIYPMIERKLRFINLEAERMADTARRLDELAELADMENITTQELTLMKFCAMTTDGELAPN